MFNVPPIYFIPRNINFIVVSDLFLKDYSGGAELTLEALLDKAPGKVFKLHSSNVTEELVQDNKDKYWIFGNFAHLKSEMIIEIVNNQIKYSILEFDYKFCKYRSQQLHFLQEHKDCDCYTQRWGKFIRAFYAKAQNVFFMSQKQMDVYNCLFPNFPKNNFLVLSSVFSDQTLEELKSLRENKKENNGRFAIMGGGSWIKAERETIQWCEENHITYDVVGGLPPQEFLNKLSQYKGLVFRPAGYDTCPRLVIEAKCLGLDILLNENVQHKDEKWFSSSIDICIEYLKSRPGFFWEKVFI